LGYLRGKENSPYLWLLSVGGLALSFLWRARITSHRNLNIAG